MVGGDASTRLKGAVRSGLRGRLDVVEVGASTWLGGGAIRRGWRERFDVV